MENKKQEKPIGDSVAENTPIAKKQNEEIAVDEQFITNNFIEALRSFMSEKYGDYSNVENILLFADVLQKLDEDHNECEILSEQNRMIAETLAAHPRLMILIQELINGTPLRVALAKSDLTHMQPDIDDEDYDAYNMAVAVSRQRRDDAKKNAQYRIEKCNRCGEVAAEFYTLIEATDDEVSEFIGFLNYLVDAIYDAEIDSDVLSVLWKAFVYDKEIRKAREEGVIEGRNSIIETRKANNSDGLPSFSSAGNTQNNIPKEGYIERLMKQKFI